MTYSKHLKTFLYRIYLDSHSVSDLFYVRKKDHIRTKEKYPL